MASKRPVENDIASFANNLNKANYAEACVALKKQCRTNPSQAHVVKELLIGMALTAPSQTAEEDQKPYAKSQGVMSKFPKNIRKKVLLQRLPQVKDNYLKIWKHSDKDIEEHMFEFEFGLSASHPWPQGACHMKGMMEEVLPLWADHWQKRHKSARLANADASLLLTGTDFDWAGLGVYVYGPVGHDEKTCVIHRPSGKSQPLPKNMQGKVTEKWSFDKNWSDNSAICVDSEGFPNRPVRTFFEDKEVHNDVASWVEFATARANEIMESRSKGVVRSALAHIQNQSLSASSHVAAGGSISPTGAEATAEQKPEDTP